MICFPKTQSRRKGVSAVWIETNNNPMSRRVGDCSVRAVATALGISWEEAYTLLAAAGYRMGNVISSNEVITAVLRQHGFYKKAIPNTCPDCYTIADFCEDHPYGTFVLFTSGHVATVIDGDLYDVWDSSDEIPLFYCYRREDD